jgi:formate dehydrogenase subunit gamma
VGICFILLALSGLAFFHPAFYPLTQLFGGGVWARILHPIIGWLMAIGFVVMFFRFKALNRMDAGRQGVADRVGEMMDGNDHNMPEQGKYNGGQKAMFWAHVGVHAAAVRLRHHPVARLLQLPGRCGAPRRRGACRGRRVMIAMIIVHVYAAIWVKGTIRAMWYGTVTRAWAKQHHRAWYRQMTGKRL